LKLRKALHGDNRSFGGVGTHLDTFQSSQLDLGTPDTGNHARIAHGQHVKFGRERRLNDCELGSGIQKKFQRAGSVDRDRNTYLRTIQ
jgi:hypothetical protein